MSIALKENDPFWWKGGNSRWVKTQFGDNLIEKDGLTYANGTHYNGIDCSICGKNPELHEHMIQMEFSFCEEYSCGMIICADCIKRFSLMINKGG